MSGSFDKAIGATPATAAGTPDANLFRTGNLRGAQIGERVQHFLGALFQGLIFIELTFASPAARLVPRGTRNSQLRETAAQVEIPILPADVGEA